MASQLAPVDLRRGEQIVLFSPTDLKNRSGVLYLTTDRLHWSETNGNYVETIYFSDIRSTLVSNATSKRVCLKLVTKQEALGCVFYFTSANARAELDNFKDTLCRLSKDKSKSDREHNSSTSSNNSAPTSLSTSSEEKKDSPTDSDRQNYRGSNKPRDDPFSNQAPPSQPQQPHQLQQPHRYHFDEHEDYDPYGSSPSPKSSNNPIMSYSNNNQQNHDSVPSQASKPRSAHPDDDDFFSIKEDEFEGGPLRGDGGHTAKSFEIEVRDPQQELESSGGKLYVSYEIVWTRDGQPQHILLRRRYKDFEWLYQHIVGNYQHRTTIPPFPSKSILKTIGNSLPYVSVWLNSSDGSTEFTQKRCAGLDKFMKSFVRSPILLQSKSLQVFLSNTPIEHDGPGGVVGFLGKVESHLSGASTTRKIDDIDVADQNLSDVEMDYKYVRELMMRWDLTPKKLPFEKFLVVVLGTTSAGKSAFVNHFFGLQVKRSAVGLETLSKEKFAEYSDKTGLPKPNFSDEDLARKISGDVYADPRYGYVFYYLDTFKTLSRYEAQFTNYAHYISNYGLVRSIIINEEYLRGSPHKIQLAKRTILLDSPGFDYTKENEHAMEKFLGNLKILQLFYSMSDLSLFMTPATHINMVSNQIATLELSVLYSLHGPEYQLEVGFLLSFDDSRYVDKLLQEILAAPTTNSSGAPTHLIPSIVDIKNYVVQKFMHATSSTSESKKAEYKGTVVWDKIRFVLTKIDEVYVNQPVGNLHEQYFELGRLLGKNLTYLEAPTFSQCLAIGLPEHQSSPNSFSESDPRVGDLKVLLDLIRSLNSESSYMSRLEASVQMMCLELQGAIKASWSTWISPKQWMSSDTAQLQDVYRRSCLRLKKMSMGGASHSTNNLP